MEVLFLYMALSFNLQVLFASMLIFPISHCCGLAFSALVVNYFLFLLTLRLISPFFGMIIIVKHMNNHLMVAGSACVADKR